MRLDFTTRNGLSETAEFEISVATSSQPSTLDNPDGEGQVDEPLPLFQAVANDVSHPENFEAPPPRYSIIYCTSASASPVGSNIDLPELSASNTVRAGNSSLDSLQIPIPNSPLPLRRQINS